MHNLEKFIEEHGAIGKDILAAVDRWNAGNFPVDKFPEVFSVIERKRLLPWEFSAEMAKEILGAAGVSHMTIIWDEEPETIYFPHIDGDEETIFFSNSGRIFSATLDEVRWLQVD